MNSRVAVHEALPPRPPGFAEPSPPPLADPQGRRYTYLRLSLTDRCDLACTYCMPPGGEEDHALRRALLTFEEAARLVRVLAAMGVRRVRLTGGEPLVRKDIVRLVEQIAATAVDEVVMTTNATRLAALAGPLREAGLRGVNVSIDTLDARLFEEVTRGGDLSRVLSGIDAARAEGLEVKLNTVLLGGVNDHELGRIVDFAWAIGATPRFIELMPIGEGAKLPPERFLSAERATRLLADRVGTTASAADVGRGPARYLPAADGSGRRVGFISALSDDFCGTCNRLRVTARGDVRACLASRRAVSLRDVMRGGGDDADVAWALSWSLSGKDEGHRFLDAAAREHESVGMSLIGG